MQRHIFCARQPVASLGYHLALTWQLTGTQGAISDCNAACGLDPSRVAPLQTRAKAKHMVEDYQVIAVVACLNVVLVLSPCTLHLLPALTTPRTW